MTVPAGQKLAAPAHRNDAYEETLYGIEGVLTWTIDGEPIDLDADYRIGSFSFLLQGGDNFHVFRDGADTADSGLIDRDAWVAYIDANRPLSPSFARRANPGVASERTG